MYPLKTLLLSLLLSGFQTLFADEGMLLPLLLKAFESDMQARGMKLTAEDISFRSGATFDQSPLWIFPNSIAFKLGA